MPSPFPGMDPYLETAVWSDFHTEFVSGIRAALQPRLRPRYVALIEHRVYIERHGSEQPGTIRPDVTVAREPANEASALRGALSTAPFTVLLPMPEPVREPYLVIRISDTMDVVTVIELLSPGNKRPGSDGQREYLAKREQVLQSAVHLVELDLLRGGERLPMAGPLPPGDYYAIVSDARFRPRAEVWPASLREPLPAIRIPLSGEEDTTLPLQQVFEAVFDRAGYVDFLNYTAPAAPPLAAADQAWADALLRK